MNHRKSYRRAAVPQRSRTRATVCGTLAAVLLLLTSVAGLAVEAPPLPPGFLVENTPAPVAKSSAPDPIWADYGTEVTQNAVPGIGAELPEKFRLLGLDLLALEDMLAAAPLEKDTAARDGLVITLPLPDGTFQRFGVVESPIIGPDVQAMVPRYRSYLAQGLDDPSAVLRLDTTQLGFHAYGRTARGSLWINPYAPGDTEHVISAWKEDFAPDTEGFNCGTVDLGAAPAPYLNKALAVTGDLLHTYRMILTLTGEYTANFGGVSASTSQALATLNQINLVFETDASVRFNVVAVNAYSNAATDPFPSGSTMNVALLQQNQATTDAVYGSGAYDIGHVLTGPGQAGLAYYQALCTNIKAQGGSSFTVPYRPSFAVTYWAHELGHQLNAPHTFNTSAGQCGASRVASGAYEPGSGSTIMSYAGACAPEDMQTVPDAYFHIGSLENIIAARASVGCGTITATGNTPPVADAGPDQVIPRGTAFWVNGAAVDPDGNTLSYAWEQLDLGAASPPLDPYGPLYRSFSPFDNGARYFPDFDQVFDGSTDPFEVMPSVDRTLTLRLTVRDNAAGGGGVDDDELVLTVAGAPFEVTAPNGGETFAAGQPVTVTWNVGGSVASDVIIWMLSSNGFSTLAGSTPNDGSESVTLPCGFTATDCRIWIQEIALAGTGARVFDVSNAVFTLNDGLPEYTPYAVWADNILVNSVASAVLPTSLIGDTTSYMWWAMANLGSAWPCETVQASASIDQVTINTANLGTAPGTWNSWGPTQPYVSGGRHTVWQVIDAAGVQPEGDETNNSYGRQWVWQPTDLPYQTAMIRSQPPERFAGLNHIPSGVTSYVNQDALRLPDDGFIWQAAAISSLDGSDYDISLFAPSTGPENGFESALVASTFGGATTDFVIAHRIQGPLTSYDAGLLRYGGSGNFVADRRTPGVALPLGGVNAGVTMAQDQIISLKQLNVLPGQEGRNVVEIDNASTVQGLDVLLFAHDTGLAARGNAIATTSVDGTGSAYIDHDFAAAGEYILVVVRKASEGLAPLTYDVSFRPTPPDIATALVVGSHGPVVPQYNSAIAIGDPIPAPTLLQGDLATTIMYFHVANNGPADANLWDLAVLMDGQSFGNVEWPFGLPGGTAAISSQSIGAYTVRGGRHTAGMFFDSADEFDELFEDNNRFAEQWVWEPTQLALGGTVSRNTPPDPMGGWDDIPVGLTREPNVDGLRTPAFANVGDNGYLGGFAATPNPGSDIDLRVHAASAGAQDGFDILQETSSQAGNATEFVLFDLDGPLPTGTAYDVGAERVSGATGYQASATESVFLNYGATVPLSQIFGPFTLGAGQLLGVFEFFSDTEGGADLPLSLVLENNSGEADLALSVFGRTDGSGFISPPEVLSGGFADNGGPGVNEEVQLLLPASQYWAVAVYKTNGDESGKTADYTLRMENQSVVDVPDVAPLVAGIANYPNPFNPLTKINFTLEKPGRTTVRIYDVQGRLVRTLVDADLGAGNHSRDWPGQDENGNVVASGVYLALFEYPGGALSQRMVLLK